LSYIGKTPTPVPLTSSDIVNGIVTGEKLNADVISSQTALAVAPADTDEFLISDAGVLKRLDASLVGGGYVYKIDNQINNTRAVISASGSKTTLISGTFTNTVASSKVLVQLKMPNYGTADGAMGIGFTYNGTDYDGAITQSQEDTDQVSFSMMNKSFTNPASTGSINWVIYFKTAGGASKRPFKTLNPNTTDDADLPQQETQITFTEYTA